MVPDSLTVRASLRWAVTQLRRQPVLILPGVLWVGSGIGFSYLILDVLHLAPNLSDPWTIPSLLTTVCMIWMGMLSQTRASLAVAAGEHLRPRHLVTLPNAHRALPTMLACGIIGLASLAGGLWLVLVYFWIFATRCAMSTAPRRKGAFTESFALMRRPGAGGPVLAAAALAVVGCVSLVGWIVLWPLADLMITYIYVRLTGTGPRGDAVVLGGRRPLAAYSGSGMRIQATT